jgi:hypothetical protein
MVKALKGHPFNRYFEVTVGGERRRFDSFTAREFHPIVHGAMARAILRRTQGEVCLVPIPNSPVTSVDHPDFRTKDLAQGIADFGQGRLICKPHLVFEEEQVSSRSGGPRDPEHFEAVYKVLDNPKGQIVLVDDVLTSGGHLIGAYWKLTARGCDLPLAATWGRAITVQREARLQVVEEDLDVSRITPDFDDVADPL